MGESRGDGVKAGYNTSADSRIEVRNTLREGNKVEHSLAKNA